VIPGSLKELTTVYQTGESNPVEVVQYCLGEIERQDSELGVVNNLVDENEIRTQATDSAERWKMGNALSPLDGVPFGVKANIAIAGLPWHAGIAAYRNRIAEQDAAVVSLMKNAGMIVIATLNMHEAAFGATSNNPAFSRTRNPCDLDRIPGGSSGGSAAAVAAGLLPVTLGTDNLGSVRLPSALCGVVGFKPSFGLVPVEGVVSLSPGLDHVGIHARTVDDIIDVMTVFGIDVGSTDAVLKSWLTSVELESEVSGIVEEAIRGLDVAEAADWRGVDLSQLRRAGVLKCELDAYDVHREMLQSSPDGFSRGFRASVEWALEQDASKIERSEMLSSRAVDRLRGDVAGSMLLSATVPCLAPLCEETPPVNMADLTGPAAMAGLPALSLPLPSPGLPVGLQLTGETDASVLAWAKKIEGEVS